MQDMGKMLASAASDGISKEKIILDGGVGFQKSHEQNLMVMHRTEALVALGCPVLIATSQKSTIGYVLDKTVEHRLQGTVATTVAGVMQGASFVRVHDVQENVEAIQMTKAILEEKRWIKSI